MKIFRNHKIPEVTLILSESNTIHILKLHELHLVRMSHKHVLLSIWMFISLAQESLL